MDSVERFTSRVDDYVRYRPSYPAGLVELLARECGLTSGSTIADVGSGTGFLSKVFLQAGYAVVGIEPNGAMRERGQQLLAEFERFRSIDGRAESTGLAEHSVDLIVVGQAFHWFVPADARKEFRRILRDAGWTALIWNERIVPESGFLKGYEEILHRWALDYGRVDHRLIDDNQISDFFGHARWRLAQFDNAQRFTLEGVRGRLLSSSYSPQPGAPGHEEMMSELDVLFQAHAVRGYVDFIYQTKVYYGIL